MLSTPLIRWTVTTSTALNLWLRRLAALREGAGPGTTAQETPISASSARAEVTGPTSAPVPDVLGGAGAEAHLPGLQGETGGGETEGGLLPEGTGTGREEEGTPPAGPGARVLTGRESRSQMLPETDAKRALKKRTGAGATQKEVTNQLPRIVINLLG